MEPEELYHYIGRLIEQMPPEPKAGEDTPRAVSEWVARVNALVQEYGTSQDKGMMTGALPGMMSKVTRGDTLEAIKMLLFNLFGAAELDAPAGARGTFIPVGSGFDFFAAVSKIFQTAQRDVLLVDPYMDETVLTEFGAAVPDGIVLRLLADEKDHKPSLTVAATKWASQNGTAKPLAVRLAPPRSLHDRAVFVDGKEAWTLTQSFKDFAKRSPGEIVRANDVAALKIAAYEDIWNKSKTIV
jgi:hypothetical protein